MDSLAEFINNFFITPNELAFLVPIGVVLAAFIAYRASRKNSRDLKIAAEKALKLQEKQMQETRILAAQQRVWEQRARLYMKTLKYAQRSREFYKEHFTDVTPRMARERYESSVKHADDYWPIFAYASREVTKLQREFSKAYNDVLRTHNRILSDLHSKNFRRTTLRLDPKPHIENASLIELQEKIEVMSKATDDLTVRIRRELLTGDIEREYTGTPRKLHTGLFWKYFGWEKDDRYASS